MKDISLGDPNRSRRKITKQTLGKRSVREYIGYRFRLVYTGGCFEHVMNIWVPQNGKSIEHT
jgi:hypothetical protein